MCVASDSVNPFRTSVRTAPIRFADDVVRFRAIWIKLAAGEDTPAGAPISPLVARFHGNSPCAELLRVSASRSLASHRTGKERRSFLVRKARGVDHRRA